MLTCSSEKSFKPSGYVIFFNSSNSDFQSVQTRNSLPAIFWSQSTFRRHSFCRKHLALKIKGVSRPRGSNIELITFSMLRLVVPSLDETMNLIWSFSTSQTTPRVFSMGNSSDARSTTDAASSNVGKARITSRELLSHFVRRNHPLSAGPLIDTPT